MLERGKILFSILARRAYKITDRWASFYWRDFPLGKAPRADKETYRTLWEKERVNSYPALDEFETEMGAALDKTWLDELALHTQIVIKNSPLCYQHGRIVYTALKHYLKTRTDKKALTIIETGTARGFSSVIMARALDEEKACGKIITLDLIPHHKPIYWNCIDDHDGPGPKSRHDILAPWNDLVEPYILFFEGDSRINLEKIGAPRIHFAFLDGAHSYRDVTAEFELITARQHPGDIIVFDDYNAVDFPGIVQAVNEGCARFAYDKTVISLGRERAYVIATKK